YPSSSDDDTCSVRFSSSILPSCCRSPRPELLGGGFCVISLRTGAEGIPGSCPRLGPGNEGIPAPGGFRPRGGVREVGQLPWRMPVRKVGMGSAGGGVTVALVIWVCVLVPAAGGIRESGDGKIEQLLLNCRLDLLGINIIKTLLEEDFAIDSTEINELLEKDDVQKAVAFLPSHMKRALADCLGRQKSPSRASGQEDTPQHWYSDHLEYFLGWRATSRRHLAAKSPHTKAPESLAPSQSPSSVADPPNSSPSPSPTYASPPSPSGQSATDSPDQLFSPFSGDESPSAHPKEARISPSTSNNSNEKKMIIAIVVTAAASVFFTALLFCCYNRCCRSRVDMGLSHRDDRPLLTLSSSDFSVGSSQKSFGMGNSIHMEKIGTLSFKSEHNSSGQLSYLPSHGAQVVSLDTSADPPSGGVSAISSFSIEPSATSGTPITPPAIAPALRAPPPPPVKPPPMRIALPPPPGRPPPPKTSIPLPPAKMSVPPPPAQMSAPPPPNPPLPPLRGKLGPRPPAPPKSALAPRPPVPQASTSSGRVPSPLGLRQSGQNHSGPETSDDAPKTKLKPFFWDKVLANPDQSMVWHQINAGSFQ
ncbi:hypothetical protein Taro_048223, partial [Colocasia esculenta]|nr:hypothetical protein [Colocasia esculenta]